MYKDLISKLRSTPSRSKRKMLDEAADAIEKLSGAECHGRWIFNIIPESLKNRQPTIEDELVRQERWISVNDSLPELIPCNAGTAYSEAVIVLTDGRKAMIAVWDGNEFLCAADYWGAWGEKITHWMPLPELPKEEI